MNRPKIKKSNLKGDFDRTISMTVITPVRVLDENFLELANSMPFEETRIEWILTIEDTHYNREKAKTCHLPDYVRLQYSNYKNATNALNAGIRICSGKFIMFVMSDDVIYANELTKLLDQYSRYQSTHIVNFGMKFCFDERYPNNKQTIPAQAITLRNSLYAGTNLCAKLYNANLLKKIGCFDPKYHFSSDRKLLLELAIKSVKQICIDSEVYGFRIHNHSFSTNKNPCNIVLFINQHIQMCDELLLVKFDFQKQLILAAWRSHELARLAYYSSKTEGFLVSIRHIWRNFICSPKNIILLAIAFVHKKARTT